MLQLEIKGNGTRKTTCKQAQKSGLRKKFEDQKYTVWLCALPIVRA